DGAGREQRGTASSPAARAVALRRLGARLLCLGDLRGLEAVVRPARQALAWRWLVGCLVVWGQSTRFHAYGYSHGVLTPRAGASRACVGGLKVCFRGAWGPIQGTPEAG